MRRSLRQFVLVSLSLWVVGLAGCDRDSGSQSADTGSSESESLADIPTDQSWSGWTEREQYFVEVAPKPNPIPFQELFELEVRVWNSDNRKEPVGEAELDEVRATMPAHNHGMKTAPESEPGGPGEFTVRGMRFHMQGLGEDGRWVVQVVLDGPSGIDRARFDVQCCRPGS